MVRIFAAAVVLALSFSPAHPADFGDVLVEVQMGKAAQAAAKLYTLDDTMQRNYAATQRMIGEMQSPVILVLFNGVGGKYILRRHGRTVSVEPVPALYQQMKSVSHTIVGVYEIISPYFDSPELGLWRPKLDEYNRMLKAALKSLEFVGMPTEVEQHCRTILEGGIAYTDTALKEGSFSSESYSAYAKGVWPAIAANVERAGKLQVDHFEDLLDEWRKEMGEEEWSRLYALVGSAWAMRRENVHFQILGQMMGKEAVNDRLIMAESIPEVTEDQLLMLLGRIINDRGLATLVFGKKYRMDVELMGESARDETETRATPHHPALGTGWMPYEEHKLPSQD